VKPADISAEEFLAMAGRAAHDGSAKPPFRELSNALQSLPATEERLAFDISAMALQSIEGGLDPWITAPWAAFLSRSVRPARQQEFAERLATIIRIAFQHLGNRQMHRGHTPPFLQTILLSSRALRRLDPNRLATLAASLAGRYHWRNDDPRFEVLSRFQRVPNE
jgi:hypothetical protein